MSNTAEATHNEVWDDSALVAGWNAAREEYEKYHSIAARGEPLELKAVEEATTINGLATEGSLDDILTSNDSGNRQSGTQVRANVAPNVNSASVPLPSAGSNIGGIGMPQSLLGSTQDEGLKSLMMAWYYAGYYTGLYEGQQKAWAEMQGST